MIALAYSVPTGVVAGWSGVLDMILTPVRVSQVRNHLTSHEERTPEAHMKKVPPGIKSKSE